MRDMVILQLITGVDNFLNIVSVLLIVYALMTWVIP